jgi:hypothetical protein
MASLGLGLAFALREKKTFRQCFGSGSRAMRMRLRLAVQAPAQFMRMKAPRPTNKQMPHPKAANKE